MRHLVRRGLLPLSIATLVGISAVVAPAALASPGNVPDQARGFARGAAAVERLGNRLPSVANAYGLTAGQLAAMFSDDETLAVNARDELLYFDVLAPGESGAAAEPGEAPGSAPPVTGPEFQLSSLPGAAKTIYLDFDGHTTVGTTWNNDYGVSTIVSPPYDTNGNPDTWSAGELQVIADSWAVVAEDFAPWNVNVTTIDPGVDALRRSGSGDNQWGARVVITDDTFANCSCGGHAYIGAFDDSQDEPTFVYNSSFAGVSEAISHEVGHMLLLAHDGTTTGATYYQGHDTAGTPGWAPIMGASYYEPVTQWSRQEYLNANNDGGSANYGNGRDDIAIISSLSNGNGFGLKVDDHGDSLASATALVGESPSVAGVIGTRTDVDVFSFTTSGGTISFAADNAATGPNLDIVLIVRDGLGGVVTQDNIADGLDAAVAATVGAGTYTVEVDGVGVGSPSSSPPNGYTDYGSIGQYTLAGSIGGVAPPDTDPPAAPTSLTAIAGGGSASLAWEANTEPDLAGYVVRRAGTAGGPYQDVATVGTNAYVDTTAPGGTSYYVVAATDTSGNTSGDSDEASATLPLTEIANGESAVFGTVSGSYLATHVADGNAQTITETESGGKPSRRHDRAEHRWSIPASQGNQILTVVATATDGGDDDNGFSLEWSDNGSTWVPLDTIQPGQNPTRTFAIGAPTGTVWVRVLDTNRAQGQRQFDSVSVDFLQVEGDGQTVDPVDPTQALAAITTSTEGAGRGQKYGVATVQVNDDQGAPVSGAAVTVSFSGDFNETMMVTTGVDGSATATTSASVRKPNFSACVDNVTASGLTYMPGTESCAS